jgi:hypothetical protein
MCTTQYYEAEELPEPEALTMRQMLDEMEEVHVLAPLVRCSKRKSGGKDCIVGSTEVLEFLVVPFRHLVSMYETHVSYPDLLECFRCEHLLIDLTIFRSHILL